MRDKARALFDIGLWAAQPGPALTRALAAHPLPGGPVRLLAVGKAAVGMAKAALAALPEPPVAALVITNAENARPLSGAEVLTAGHPLPDAAGLAASERVFDLLAPASPGDLILALMSGGGSAMLPAPVDGVSLDDKVELNRLMLAAGLEIGQINLVRQHLSRLKGGGLLRAARGAHVTSFLLSDVIGDDPRVIASGPGVAPIGTRAQAAAVLTDAGLWEQVPDSITRHLSQPPADLPPLPHGETWVIGSNRMSLAAMAAAEPKARIISDRLTGATTQAAEKIIAAARRARPGAVLLWGGETTVRVTGDGLGGRNQDLALRVAMLGRDLPFDWAFLSGGTDGRDGPTDAAGGLVDGTSARRMRTLGIDASQALARCDSNAALAADGDLLITGATGTNVADLQILVRA